MAVEIKFSCKREKSDYLKVDSVPKKLIVIEGQHNGKYFSFYLDETTAIKFAKTIRTEINKIKEVENGRR
jgi:hypothetical protein